MQQRFGAGPWEIEKSGLLGDLRKKCRTLLVNPRRESMPDPFDIDGVTDRRRHAVEEPVARAIPQAGEPPGMITPREDCRRARRITVECQGIGHLHEGQSFDLGHRACGRIDLIDQQSLDPDFTADGREVPECDLGRGAHHPDRVA